MSPGPSFRVALAGNPNCGKTSLFNALTGSHQRVGNYAGVTVEKKEGRYAFEGTEYAVLDLPGTYSLTTTSPEEAIARRELLEGRPDVTVVVVDATNLPRNLYLLTQIMAIGMNPVLCLNMSDEARRIGQRIDRAQMERLLGFPVVETVGHRGEGLEALRAAVARACRTPAAECRLVLGERVDQAVAAIGPLYESAPPPPGAPPPLWLALKLLEGEPAAAAFARERLPHAEDLLLRVAAAARALESDTRMPVATFIADRHYGFIAGLLKEVIIRTPRADARAYSDRIDAIVCHRLLGPFLFLGVMYAIFWLTFTVGAYPMAWLEDGFGALAGSIAAHWPADGALPWLRSLVIDGLLGGVGGVLVFLPNIVLLFLGLTFLEDTGYMSRAAFLVDGVMHRFGLHGKSFLPLVTGFGCSIPGIMATRTLENERDRLTTMLVLPLMSCGARLPIWMLLIPAFFPPAWHAPMLGLIYLVGIVLAAALAKLLRTTLLRGAEAPFVMELPPYRLPTLKSVVRRMAERAWAYVRKAGTVVLGISLLMWLLTNYPQKTDFDVDRELAAHRVVAVAGNAAPGAASAAAPAVPAPLSEADIQHRRDAERLAYSAAGRLGRFVEPVFTPLGFDWRVTTALFGAFVAKEVFVAQLGVIFSLGGEDGDNHTLRDALARSYDPLTTFALMLFLLVATPCMATVAVTRRESGSWKWPALQFFGLTAIAYLLAFVVYQGGRLLGL